MNKPIDGLGFRCNLGTDGSFDQAQGSNRRGGDIEPIATPSLRPPRTVASCMNSTHEPPEGLINNNFVGIGTVFGRSHGSFARRGQQLSLHKTYPLL